MKKFFLPIATLLLHSLQAQQTNPAIEKAADKIESKCIAWRRDIHEHPELGNREFRTAKMIAEHMRSLGLDVKEGVAKTGVVGILKTDRPGPVIALRADIDALPVTERNDLPFKSKAKASYNGQEVGVMHACGHDTHIAMLMSAAEILAGMKNQLKGTVVFVFQPAEEGPPAGEEGGAALMIKEGVLDNPKVDVMFGLHIRAQANVGAIGYREGGIMAESDWFTITIKGKQSHGAAPWQGIDPVIIGAQIINGLQTIVSRQMELTKNPVVISTTMFHAGVRQNIIPEEVTLSGTIRTLDKNMRDEVWKRVERTAKNIAEASGATADVSFDAKTGITYNDPGLTKKMLPSLLKASNNNAFVIDAQTGAEDFSYFAEKVPSLYFFVGGTPKDKDATKAPSHHTPDFYIDESGMKTGVKAYCYLVTDYMNLSTATSTKKQERKSF
ncbi:MAG TPA: amidohydrolase [Flavisolibacter sp.]|nr:amidohydrolase [Flavisolibacter sp.]